MSPNSPTGSATGDRRQRIKLRVWRRAGTGSRHRAGASHHAEHDRHDRRWPVHHHPADHCRRGRTAGHAGLDSWRSLRALRRPGVGRTRRGHARMPAVPTSTSRNATDRNPWAGCCRSSSSGSYRSARHSPSHRAASACPTMRDICGRASNAPSPRIPFTWASADRRARSARAGHARDLGCDRHLCRVVLLLYRQITVVGKLAELLWVGVALAVGWVIFAGLTHFSAARAFDFPPGAFTLSPGFFMGLGSAMLIATYDYWGYYNVCFLGGEVKDPGADHPARADHLHLCRRCDLHHDEHLRAGRDLVARIGSHARATRTTTSCRSSCSEFTALGQDASLPG